MKKILLTGASGFLGSNIAEGLVKQGFSVLALKRSSSNISRCVNFKEQIRWIDSDILLKVESSIIEFNPEILIHAAWDGVKAEERDNWSAQETNLSLLISLLEIAKKAGIKKIISLGSQAEYGTFEGSVSESYPCNPNSAYGTIKLCASGILKAYAEKNLMDWFWMRIFSVFGPGEDDNWLIPSAINNLLNKREMALTSCEQKYDYLYTKDFVDGILKIIDDDNHRSGIYNMASGKSTRLRDILDFLELQLSPDTKILNYGAMPYRPNQVMDMTGNSELFFKTFQFRPKYSIYEALRETVNNYIMQKSNGDKI